MDPGRYGSARTVDAVDPVSYDTWPTLASAHQQQRSYCSPCSRRRLTWTAVSVLELILMILTAVYCFFLPKKYLGQIVEKENRGKINELSEWVLRMYGSMICVQVRGLEKLSYLILSYSTEQAIYKMSVVDLVICFNSSFCFSIYYQL